MPFKEKIAWISVVTTILVWGSYFGFLLATGVRLHGSVYIVGFVGAVIAQTILMIIASIVTAVMSPKDASAGSDERDREIARRSYAIAYPGPVVAGRLCRRMPASGVHRARHGLWDHGRDRDCRDRPLRRADRRLSERAAWLSPCPESVVNQIRLLRFMAGEMTQAELGDRIGMTRQTIAAIEAGKYSPTLEAAFRIAQVFGKPLDEVFQWEG